ncbi:GNAT family N-acetyltransferase [Ruegeria sp. Ofav3-42]|uniref:GNAT family N-acetyltransferase n=1 Tax=Ruegeria sp. Ofav3-42 TaxID=2917759 RepID=UPI001EF49EC4|nr:GNAT family N-acetyltransferase [Ruegeria sp. Ofav3-42]MCG7521512.1 GNAT family N-acetyltransferase [Ruegeria sp. Ofav3-42]
MSDAIKISPLNPSSDQLERLAIEAAEQGYSFFNRLINDAKSGANNFSRTGECFLGVYSGKVLVGCGGINFDPFTDRKVGRLRHVYVLDSYRRKGIASNLVKKLLEHSKATFSTIRLRTPDQNANEFYEAIGFSRINNEHATHAIEI